MKLLGTLLIATLCLISQVYSGSTGKIAGKVVDAKTKEPLIGINVIIAETRLGASTDLEGQYNILNVPPGIYTIKASAVGFHPSTVQEVKVSVDLTTKIDFELTEATIQLNQEVVVVAQRPIVQKDLTSTSSKLSSDQIKSFPVEDVSGLINLQAGVVEGHFRGGRAGEVLYLIDGVPVTDAYSGGAGVTAENSTIEELEVISGTFNAEYGQAMSGVVNQITKDGGERYSGSISMYTGDYISSHKSTFMNIESVSPSDIYNLQGTLSGPLEGTGMTFFVSGRLYSNNGYLYGKRVFMPTDLSNFSDNDPTKWRIVATGDGAYVPMDSEKRTTLQSKITIPSFGSDKLRLSYLNQARDFRNYDHRYKYNPDGAYKNKVRGDLAGLNYNGVVASTTFWELHTAWFSNREQSYVYEDPYDTLFPPANRKLQTSGPAFYTGGAEDLHLHRESRYWLTKVDLVSQLTNEHQLKMGAEGKWHRIWIHNFGIQNDQTTNFKPRPVEYGRSEFANVVIRPAQYSAYIQDKMEFSDFIVNLGIRFDYFDPKGNVLDQPLKLGNALSVSPASTESQFSPRFGLAFPITDRGVLHLSYGHFFQVPQFDLIYLNPAYNINATEVFQVGNPGLKSERTVAYEFGLQQQLGETIGLDVTAYYKDFRNLIGTRIFDIGNGNKYSQYVNQDYGNARGFILSFERRYADGFSATIDYTFQIAKGNASDPNSVFLDNVTDPPRESQKQLAPLDWDRRHSLNISATVGERGDYTLTLIGRLGSGLPYTPAFQNQRTGLLNSESRPLTYNLDLYATKEFGIVGTLISIFVKVYNVFDTMNEPNVFTDTGRANYSLEANYSGSPRGINTIQEYYLRPDFYSAPRQLIIGAELAF